MSTIEDEARAAAIERYSSRVIEDYDGDRYDEDEYGYDATARSAFVKGALWAASRREPSEASANVSNRPKDDISSGEMSVSEPSDTDERWEYGYYDSDDANDPARVFHQYVQGWSFPTAEAAKHTGDKNVFGKAIIVRRHPASDWEVCDEH